MRVAETAKPIATVPPVVAASSMAPAVAEMK
jgi:hypothetical protein